MTKAELELKVKELESKLQTQAVNPLDLLDTSVKESLQKAIKSGSLPFLLSFGNEAEKLLSEIKTAEHCELFTDSTAKAIGSGFVSKVTGNRKEWNKEQKEVQDRFTGLQKFVKNTSLELRVERAANKAAQKGQEIQTARRIGARAAQEMQNANANA